MKYFCFPPLELSLQYIFVSLLELSLECNLYSLLELSFECIIVPLFGLLTLHLAEFSVEGVLRQMNNLLLHNLDLILIVSSVLVIHNLNLILSGVPNFMFSSGGWWPARVLPLLCQPRRLRPLAIYGGLSGTF